jgi:hypothetical protein
MKRLDALGKREFNQQMRVRSGRLSEQLAQDWKKNTLPGLFADACQNELQNEYEEMAAIEKNLADARQAYASSFAAIALDVKRLEAMETSLRDLAITPNTRREMADFFQHVYAAYRKAQEDAQKDKTPPAANPKG